MLLVDVRFLFHLRKYDREMIIVTRRIFAGEQEGRKTIRSRPEIVSLTLFQILTAACVTPLVA